MKKAMILVIFLSLLYGCTSSRYKKENKPTEVIIELKYTQGLVNRPETEQEYVDKICKKLGYRFVNPRPINTANCLVWGNNNQREVCISRVKAIRYQCIP